VSRFSSGASTSKSFRSVGLLLLLTVFFLPLHFHSLTATAHVAKECSCIHGAKTQTGMVPVLVDWVPPVQQLAYQPVETPISSRLVLVRPLIRAPPVV
jgi:hypothetical protein